jgi:hypothetical protein
VQRNLDSSKTYSRKKQGDSWGTFSGENACYEAEKAAHAYGTGKTKLQM